MEQARQALADKQLEKKVLLTQIGYVCTWKEALDRLFSLGYRATVAEVPAVKWNRRKFNIMNWTEQEAYEKRMNETKTEYSAELGTGSYVINKSQFNYLKSLEL